MSCFISQAQAYSWIYLEKFCAGNIIILYLHNNQRTQKSCIETQFSHPYTILTQIQNITQWYYHVATAQTNMTPFILFTENKKAFTHLDKIYPTKVSNFQTFKLHLAQFLALLRERQNRNVRLFGFAYKPFCIDFILMTPHLYKN